MTEREKLLAVARIRKWPREERVFLTQLPPREAELIGELVVLLDARPADEPARPS